MSSEFVGSETGIMVEVQTDVDLGVRFGRTIKVKLHDGELWNSRYESMFALLSVDQARLLRKALKKAIKDIEGA